MVPSPRILTWRTEFRGRWHQGSWQGRPGRRDRLRREEGIGLWEGLVYSDFDNYSYLQPSSYIYSWHSKTRRLFHWARAPGARSSVGQKYNCNGCFASVGPCKIRGEGASKPLNQLASIVRLSTSQQHTHVVLRMKLRRKMTRFRSRLSILWVRAQRKVI